MLLAFSTVTLLPTNTSPNLYTYLVITAMRTLSPQTMQWLIGV